MPFNGWNIPSICKMIQIADTIVFQYLLECKPIFFAFSRQRFQSLPFRLFGLFFFLGFFGKSICFLLSPYSFFCYSFFILYLFLFFSFSFSYVLLPLCVFAFSANLTNLSCSNSFSNSDNDFCIFAYCFIIIESFVRTISCVISSIICFAS